MPANQIPVETILKLALDTSSADQIKDWLDEHNKQWSTVERTIGRIGDSLEGITRFGMGLVGLGGIGALAEGFLSSSQYGGLAALAAGHATGGNWHGYQQAMLSAQARTGVQASEITQGLVLALQAAGGNPTPGQAAALGGVLAGIGQVSGMTPAQVATVVGPLLQAAGRSATANNILGLTGSMLANLGNFPGSQSAPMMGLISNVALQQAIGSTGAGAVNKSDIAQLAAIFNTAAGSNSIFRNTSVAGSAISGIMGGMQGAYTNAPQEAFLQMAGIGYWQQRQGLSKAPAGEIEKIMGEATRLYGTGVTRDEALRSMFGLSGADLLEQFSPGSAASKRLQQAVAHPNSQSAKQLGQLIHHATLSSTPGASLAKIEGDVQKWVFGSFGHAAIAGAGVLGGGALLRRGVRGVGRGAKSLLGRGASALTEGEQATLKDLADRVASGRAISMAESDTLDQLLEKGGLSLGDVLGGGGSALARIAGLGLRAAGPLGAVALASQITPALAGDFGISISGGLASRKQYASAAQSILEQAARRAQGRFGKHWDSARGLAFMRHQIANTGTWPNMLGGNDAFNTGTLEKMALSGVTNLARELSQATTAMPINTRDSAVVSQLSQLRQAIKGLQSSLGGGATGTAYHGSSTALSTAYGHARSTVTSGNGGEFVSFPSMGGGALTAIYGHSSGYSAGGAGGGSSRATAISAAAKRYGVPASLLWGIYGAESTYGTAYKPGQKTYGYFGLTGGEWTSGMSFQQDANAAAMTLAADIREKGGVNAGIESYSGGSYGLAHVQALARSAPRDTRPIHVHVHVDGRKIQQSRVQRGKTSPFI